ncbi:MFS transporter [Bacillus sp. FJAT-49736]|uniref:MFS transporter n=1 Tax=Bacillus sp. FJAT-49736 TaxID=2833582 RepID=UPI001BC99581|nr:MFS transporter [Bacillus sp. FJAT-49736]MBS4175141.1 MFS transporter [Bacillus sp. FJAT-49736]
MKNQTWLSLNYFAFFFTWGVFMPYWTGWLVDSKGLTVQAASAVIGAGFISRSISTLLVFPAFCRHKSIAFLLKIFPIISAILLFLFLPFTSVNILTAIMVFFTILYPLILPLMESTGTMMVKADGIHYGKSRRWGSIGYTVALIVVGIITSIYKNQAIFYIMAFGMLLMMVTTNLKSPPSINNKIGGEKGSSYKGLFQSKRFLLGLVIAILLQGAHASYNNYGFLYLQDLHVDNFYIGFILNIAVIAEIIFFSVADRFFQKTSIPIMFIIAGIGSVVRWLVIFIFPSAIVFIAMQLLHSLTFGLTHYTLIRLINEELRQQDIPAAQAVYTSIGMGLIVGIFTYLGGFLYSHSPGLAFGGMSLFALPCIFIAAYMHVHQKKIAQAM